MYRISQFFAIYSSCIFRLGITCSTTMTLLMVNEMTIIRYTELRQIHQNHNDWLAYFASVLKFDDAPPARVNIKELRRPRRRPQEKFHKFAYLTMKNSIFARFARAFFIFWHFARTFSFFLRRERTCLLCGRLEHMMTNIQFCLLMSQVLVPIYFQNSYNTFFKHND